MYCCFIVLFMRGGLFTGLFISDSINFMITMVVVSYSSVYTTLYIRLSILNYSTTLMVNKFELCSSKESIKFCLLTTSFLKNLSSTSRHLTFYFSTHISSFSLDSEFSVKFKSYISSKRYDFMADVLPLSLSSRD